MRRSSSWFLGLLLTVSLLGGCSAAASRTAAPSLNLDNAYRAALSLVMASGE